MNPFNLTIEELAKAYKWSEKTVERRVDDGTFTYGKEYVDVRGKNAKKRELRFNLEACQKLFLIPPEKR